MRPQTLQNEVIGCLADGHWWSVGELADTIDCYRSSVRRVLRDLEQRGFVERFDDERPAMFGWTVEPKAVEREREAFFDQYTPPRPIIEISAEKL